MVLSLPALVLSSHIENLLVAEFAKKAVEADNKGDLQEALENYKNAVEWFMTHLKYDKNPSSQEAIKQKVNDLTPKAVKVQ